MMDSNSIQFELLFDADSYHRSGKCPWTFFAYPTILSDERNLPPDEDACNLLATLQKRGIRVAVWESSVSKDTTFFACPMEDRQKLDVALNEIDVRGINGKDFCTSKSEKLFASLMKRN